MQATSQTLRENSNYNESILCYKIQHYCLPWCDIIQEVRFICPLCLGHIFLSRVEHERDQQKLLCHLPLGARPSHAFQACASSYQQAVHNFISQSHVSGYHNHTYFLRLADNLVSGLGLALWQIVTTIDSDAAYRANRVRQKALSDQEVAHRHQ